MDPRAQRHALLFRRLTDACGGIPAIMAADPPIVRLTKPSQLYRFADPNSACFPPSDVIEDLELYCGQALFTGALVSGLPAHMQARDLLQEACESSVALGELMRLVLAARAQPGGMSPRARAGIITAIERLSSEVRDVLAAALDGSTS